MRSGEIFGWQPRRKLAAGAVNGVKACGEIWRGARKSPHLYRLAALWRHRKAISAAAYNGVYVNGCILFSSIINIGYQWLNSCESSYYCWKYSSMQCRRSWLEKPYIQKPFKCINTIQWQCDVAMWKAYSYQMSEKWLWLAGWLLI